MPSGPWTDDENDSIVAKYFEMLARDFSGSRVNKAENNRAVQALIGRGRSAIEYKHQNISAVLVGMGEDWLRGYRPAYNYQSSLEDAVARWLAKHEDWLNRIPADTGLADAGALWLDPPPTLRNAPPPEETRQAMAVAQKFDVALRDERNRALGRAGERRALAHERSALAARGRRDLAEQVRWVSDEDGDGAGYDIASFELDGRPRLIEVKTTNGWERTPFHISRNELRVAEEMADRWCVLRLYQFARGPKAFELRPPLEAHVSLTPTSFQAQFR